MSTAAWLRWLIIAAVIAYILGAVGIGLGASRLGPMALLAGELCTILAAIAWSTPDLPLFSATQPIIPANAGGVASDSDRNAQSDVAPDAQTATPAAPEHEAE